mmetsp:Transcript_15725/g.23142  ORF Transcript_15725/g.23142 Transcript_15725/m.23142 type:complete len:590 (+) Transcript_15725:180-1949(+)|eukprot:CAMPEP_0194217980 /NCGR_PEP_ID=MMETSP0156-20130528/22664_1 /TAXON_ID=33649 /ORGANISM="Thalassionema nitzschioides, Strain L26-B" /LENGTH=589 /DNA_ID=CAMNT_0038947173 /DNA_START=113 /DNA_END=1882 /DNA_ORIENTATION=+
MVDDSSGERPRKRRNRWGDMPEGAETSPPPPSKAKALALKESVAARLAALKAKKAASAVNLNKRPVTATGDQPLEQSVAKKAKTFELDMTVTGPTYQAQAPIQKPKVNPYLANQKEDKVEEEVDYNVDETIVRASKPRERNKKMRFVEPGTFVQLAERKRQKEANAFQSGFISGRKAGTYIQSTGMAGIYGAGATSRGDFDERIGNLAPRADCGDPESMPLFMEWWDTEFLPSKLRKQVQKQEILALKKKSKKQLQKLAKLSTKQENGDGEEKVPKDDMENMQVTNSSCFEQSALSYSKTAALVQHIVPIGIQSEEAAQPTLFLTKKELKRQRKLRRAEAQRELQDRQAAGLVEAPEPRLTLQNFIRVLGDQAYLDPSQMEQKVNDQMQARQKAHLERNEANKATKEQKAEKRARKLQEDASEGVSVAIFYVKDMSHTYHRTKVDLNAQQNNITGGVLECAHPSLACVICEGGPKAIKRYTRLMTVRMKWKGPEDAALDEEEDADGVEDGKPVTQRFNPDNECELIWTGMARKRLFSSFVFQVCENSDIARKVLKSKGVAHYWDQLISRVNRGESSLQLKLVDSDDDED